MYSFCHLAICFSVRAFMRVFICSSILSFFYSPVRACIFSFVRSSARPLIRSFIHSLINSFTHSLTHSFYSMQSEVRGPVPARQVPRTGCLDLRPRQQLHRLLLPRPEAHKRWRWRWPRCGDRDQARHGTSDGRDQRDVEDGGRVQVRHGTSCVYQRVGEGVKEGGKGTYIYR